MRLLITGASGLLGLNLALDLRDRYQVFALHGEHAVAAPGITPVHADGTRPGTFALTVAAVKPDAIVHAAGLTRVDDCETRPELAVRLNVGLAREVAAAAHGVGARLLHVSTDQLFDGRTPHRGETDQPAPLNVYGRTKADGEAAVREAMPTALVIRTNFFGWGPPFRRSFSDWILDGLIAGSRLRMFTDAFFTPILVNDLGDAIAQLLGTDLSGVLNVAGRERLSKYDFAVRLARQFGHDPSLIEPASLREFPFRARRPLDLSLDVARIEAALGRPMPTASEGLERLAARGRQQWPATVAVAAGARAGSVP